jgi:hypothetical protein
MKRAILLLLVCGLAWADDKAPPAESGGAVDVSFETKPPDPKVEGAAPTVEATVINGPRLPIDKFGLREDGAKDPIELHPSAMRDFLHGNETVAIAIVMNTSEVWVGNDSLIGEGEPGRYLGILKGLEQAIDSVKIGDFVPPGSQGVVVTFADKAQVRVKMGPLSNITGNALGTQKEYQGTKGSELVKGIELAMAELHNVTAARKLMIIICDGADTNNDAAKVALKNDRALAGKDHIQAFGIIYRGQLSDETINVVPNFTGQVTTVSTAENIASTMTAILSRLNDRFYLTFPGYDTKLGVGLPWDGKTHKLVLRIDKDDQDAQEVVMVPPWDPPKKGGLPWLWIILGAVVLLLLIVIIIAVASRKPVPMPAPMPVAAPEAAAPQPQAPMRTVMLSAGGDQDGFPIVGWLVPLNGQNAYQTFRLRSGLTKIGTQNTDIVINDGFMSTEHCQIQCSPAGFTLVDGGSTNGSYVNDKRVSRHELIDNDMITLGKTNFKFKSVS